MQIIWSPQAVEDRDAQFEYYADFNYPAARRMRDAVLQQTRLLGVQPNIGRPGMRHGTRELVISRTPYIVVYSVDTQVRILRLFHGAQDWPGRY